SAPPQMRVAGKRAPKRMPAMVISAAPEREALAALAPAAPVVAAPVVAAPVAAAPVVAAARAAPPAVATPPSSQAAFPAAPAVRQGSFFDGIGLRQNDVVLRVDNRAINGVEDASAAYAWLRVTNKFSVDVLRDGRPLTLRYVISQPMTASAQ